MPLVYFGSGPFAVSPLDSLAASPVPEHRPALVVTRPDRPAGRGRKLSPTPVRARALELGLPCEAPLSANDPEFVERLRAFRPDIIIVADYGEILRGPLRALPRVGVFNLHASLLPRHRGAAPVFGAILEGDAVTGVTLFRIEKGLDSGPIVDRLETAIEPAETAGELEARLEGLAARLLERNLPRLLSGTFREEAQENALATLAPKIEKGIGPIDWTLPAPRLANFIRALSPRPGAYSFLRASLPSGSGSEKGGVAPPLRVKFLRAIPAPGQSSAGSATAEAGTVTAVEKNSFRVAAGPEGARGEIEILSLQPEGRNALTAAEFLRGYPLKIGDRFGPGEKAPAAPADSHH